MPEYMHLLFFYICYHLDLKRCLDLISSIDVTDVRCDIKSDQAFIRWIVTIQHILNRQLLHVVIANKAREIKQVRRAHTMGKDRMEGGSVD